MHSPGDINGRLDKSVARLVNWLKCGWKRVNRARMGKLRDTVACNYDNFSAQLSRVDYSLQLGQVSQGRRRKFRIPRITLTFRYESSWKILIKRLKKILLRYLEDFDRIYFYLSSICCSIIAFIFYNNFKLVEI